VDSFIVRSRWTIFDVMHKRAIRVKLWRCSCRARMRRRRTFDALSMKKFSWSSMIGVTIDPSTRSDDELGIVV